MPNIFIESKVSFGYDSNEVFKNLKFQLSKTSHEKNIIMF